MTVGEIRKILFDQQKGQCKMCSKTLNWFTCHMNEIIPKSKGGQTSLENSEILCPPCHLKVFHSDRAPQFKKKT